ncbi:MAG: hypothetical protein KDE50_19755, partial [Caldilineaceae bacterium]|nr:hypothetical protein [Caldilineaceae bacterium]
DQAELDWRQELGFYHALHGHILAIRGENNAALENARVARSLLPAARLHEASILAIIAEAQSRFALGEHAAAVSLLVDAAARLRSAGELWLRTRVLNDLTFRLRT